MFRISLKKLRISHPRYRIRDEVPQLGISHRKLPQPPFNNASYVPLISSRFAKQRSHRNKSALNAQCELPQQLTARANLVPLCSRKPERNKGMCQLAGVSGIDFALFKQISKASLLLRRADIPGRFQRVCVLR